MRGSFKSKKEQSQVDWKSVILENRQMMLKEGLVVSELELLWEYAMLFGTDTMREYYSEQKRQLDIRSQLLLTTKKVLSINENNFIQVEEPKVYDALTFVIPEGADLHVLLHEYAHAGFDAGISKLIEKGVDLETLTPPLSTLPQGLTPLHHAAQCGHTKCCEVLINHSANIEAQTAREFTPLILAAMGNKEETFDYLLSRGADLHTRPRGGSILHCATYHLNIIKKLVKLGVPVDRLDLTSKTALFKCSENNNVEGALQLIEYGADIFLGDSNGEAFCPLYPILIRTSDIKVLKDYMKVEEIIKNSLILSNSTN